MLLVAGVLQVPADFPTIQGAIDAASDGDVVLVSPGTYVETIDFHGKKITVESSAGAEETVIDAAGISSVATFTSGEDASSVLRGFTLTGGVGSLYQKFFDLPLRAGGGVHVQRASPRVESCIIRGNEAADVGGGIFVGSTYRDTVFPQPVFIDCLVESNLAGSGGGAHIEYYAADWTGELVIEFTGCCFSSNVATSTGGGAHLTGTHSVELQVEFTDCVFEGNQAGSGGGGFLAAGDEGSNLGASLVGCTLVHNRAAVGGAVYVFDYFGSDFELRDCFVAWNQAEKGGALYGVSGPDVRNCTIVENVATIAGGASSGDPSGPDYWNCILWGNHPDQVTVEDHNEVPDLDYCDVQGGSAWGEGNIDADPLFVDPEGGDFHLLPGSPCIDSGNPTSPLDEDGTPADMGAFPYQPWKDLGQALAGGVGAPELVGTGSLNAGTPTKIKLTNAASSSPMALVVGFGPAWLPLKGGILVPSPDWIHGSATGPGGAWAGNAPWPAGLPSGAVTYFQAWIVDEQGPQGLSASNGLSGTTR